MRNRKGQRMLKKRCEELLSPRDMTGLKDPTPYEAVKNIRDKQIAEIKEELRAQRKKESAA